MNPKPTKGMLVVKATNFNVLKDGSTTAVDVDDDDDVLPVDEEDFRFWFWRCDLLRGF
jgi:hypothetical protein